MIGPIVNAIIQLTVIVFDVRFLCSNFSIYNSVNYVSTNLTNDTLRTGYAINDVRAMVSTRYLWVTVKSVTNHIGDSQLSDVKSVTGVSQFGDSHNLSTNDIFRPYISRMPCLHLAKFIVQNNFQITF